MEISIAKLNSLKQVFILFVLLYFGFCNYAVAANTIKVYPIDDGMTHLYDGENITSWSSARSYSGSFGTNPTVSDSNMSIRSDNHNGGKYRIYRGSMVFDTSAIPDDAVIESAVLNFFKTGGNNSGDIDLVITSHVRASTTVLAKGDHVITNFGTTEFSRDDLSSDAYNDFTLNSSGINHIDVDNFTTFGILTEYDYDDSAPPNRTITSAGFYSVDETGVDSDPYLEITYTIPVTDETVVKIQPGPEEGKDTYYGVGSVGGQEGRPDSSELRIGGWGDEWFTFIEFDLESLPENSIVTSATLNMFSKNSNAPNKGKLFRVTEPWIESDPSSISSPTFVDTGMQWRSVPDNDWWSVDVVDVMQDWVSDNHDNYGFRITAESNTNDHVKSFYSSDYLDDPSLRPYLEIVYTVDATTTPEVTFASLAEDVIDAIESGIEHPVLVPVFEDFMGKITKAYNKDRLVRADRKLAVFKELITSGLGKTLFSGAERKEIKSIIKEMQDILLEEG